MFKVILGKKGLTETYQDEFPETTECVHCKKESRIGFVAHEGIDDVIVEQVQGQGNEARLAAVSYCRRYRYTGQQKGRLIERPAQVVVAASGQSARLDRLVGVAVLVEAVKHARGI